MFNILLPLLSACSWTESTMFSMSAMAPGNIFGRKTSLHRVPLGWDPSSLRGHTRSPCYGFTQMSHLASQVLQLYQTMCHTRHFTLFYKYAPSIFSTWNPLSPWPTCWSCEGQWLWHVLQKSSLTYHPWPNHVFPLVACSARGMYLSRFTTSEGCFSHANK